MSEYTDSFNIDSKALSERALAQDRDDYYFAISGVDVGRYRKHILNSNIDPVTGKKKKDEVAEAMLRTLEDWLRDENYRKAHEALLDTLHGGLLEAASVLDQIRDQIIQTKAILEKMLDRAPRLPDGRRVFRFADGTVKDKEGNVVDDALVANIHWPNHSPTGEEYFGLRERFTDLETKEREVLGIETDLGDIHNRALDNDNPLTPDELEKETNRADGLRDRLNNIQNDLTANAPSHIQPSESLVDNKVEGGLVALSSLPKIGGN